MQALVPQSYLYYTLIHYDYYYSRTMTLGDLKKHGKMHHNTAVIDVLPP